MRLDEVTQHADVQKNTIQSSRSGRHRTKEEALTRGGLEPKRIKKSAEALVGKHSMNRKTSSGGTSLSADRQAN